MRRKKILLLALLAPALLQASASASSLASPKYDKCFTEAAIRQSIPKAVLFAIAEQESGFNPRVINTNTNGSTDIGIMQINSWWLPTLKSMGIEREHLFDPCTNIHVGAWIFAQGIVQHGWNWRGIGSYNARNEARQIAYAKKILIRWKAFDHQHLASK